MVKQINTAIEDDIKKRIVDIKKAHKWNWQEYILNSLRALEEKEALNNGNH